MTVYGSYAVMLDNNSDSKKEERIQALFYMLNRTSVLHYSSSSVDSADAYLEKIKMEKELLDFWKECGFEFLKNI